MKTGTDSIIIETRSFPQRFPETKQRVFFLKFSNRARPSFQLSLVEVRLRGAEEERDTLRADLADSSAGQDVIVRKAWETRDKAVKRKNAAEVELAKERIGVMQVRGCSLSRFVF